MGRRPAGEIEPGAHRRPDAGQHRLRQNFAKRHDYPWGEIPSVRHEVFTRRGGM
jgi:hypothetical protein